jgi:hypothetical protein
MRSKRKPSARGKRRPRQHPASVTTTPSSESVARWLVSDSQRDSASPMWRLVPAVPPKDLNYDLPVTFWPASRATERQTGAVGRSRDGALCHARVRPAWAGAGRGVRASAGYEAEPSCAGAPGGSISRRPPMLGRRRGGRANTPLMRAGGLPYAEIADNIKS